MYTVTKVMMAESMGNAKVADPEMSLVHESRYASIFQNELDSLAKGGESVLFEWGVFRDGAVEALSDKDKEKILAACHFGWEKLANKTHWSYSWDWVDIVDAEQSCNWALLLGDAKLRMLHSHTYQGPLRRGDTGCRILDKECQTQSCLAFASSGWRTLQRLITDVALPHLGDAKMKLRSRMGEIDISAEFDCVQCGREFPGSKGFVVLDATRRKDGRGGLSGLRNGLHCLDCFGH